MNKTKIWLLLGFIICGAFTTCEAHADDEMNLVGFSLSPMSQLVELTPGQSQSLTIDVINPENTVSAICYEATVNPFLTDQTKTDYTIVYNDITSYNQIVNWIKIYNPTGCLNPGESATLDIMIQIPKDAPGGGQYAAITVTRTFDETSQSGSSIVENVQIASLIYASVAGSTKIDGQITEISIPSFIFNPPIMASSTVKNTGNVHQDATYTLQVYPLFSDEEIYTNEESPSSTTVLPDQSFYHLSTWDNAPFAGIFRVVQTVAFAGQTTSIEQTVIICPLWLLFIIIFGIILLIGWISARRKHNLKHKK